MIIAGGYLSSINMKWLYLTIFGILFHMITDVLDGSVGKYRKTGAIIWGYFMDHTMDVIVTISISIALALVFPKFQFYILVLLGLQLLLMITAFLSLDNNGLDISICHNKICLGPTDMLILIACLFLFTIYFKSKINKYFFIVLIILLTIVNIYKIFQKQKKAHQNDMTIKKQS
jgi:phosphatidylglycerophosphate synthase